MKAAFEGPEGGLTAGSRGPGGFEVDRAGPERVGVRGPARDRDAGALGRKASGGLSAVGRLLDTGVLSVWLAGRGGAAGREAGLAPLTWGGVVARAAAASNCALLTLPPPPPRAAGMRLLPGSQSQPPRV